MARHIAAEGLVGHRVLDDQGQNIGKIKQVFLDERTNEPTWVSVHTGLFGMKETLVPLKGSRNVEDDIQVPYDKTTVKDAPNVEGGHNLTDEEKAVITDYFARHGSVPRQAGGEADRMTGAGAGAAERSTTREGMPEEGAASRGGMPEEGAAGEGSATRAGMAGERGDWVGASEDEEIRMVRHEEEVDIGVERRESGQARIHKSVESEHFDETVPLHHEEIQVERRPITDPSQVEDPGGMAESEERFVLHEERPVVSKREVPVEEVRVRKHEVSHDEHVEGERLRERIEMDDGDEPGGPAPR
ncbi:DUF2382 domain-containing protein [Nocardiopsis aegyptia]|uniref:Uncharacterized protein (TIGR02271 family) n=1 Tax=Nocardiopsis aegyptia TaxID=220378 RepID=A0A7Z0J909_9ACTN|nr:PRC and DUF2382 domain-containing protein [Nocardiopsis aegyptia]NYJ32989.1 uncharacterized protein (TIGR02271 family) [Nocardiopsis aegyptia]